MAIVNLLSLREQVYNYLRDQMHKGHIMPDVMLNLNEISKILGVSKTPLRDALIRLEAEGFVAIYPRKGVSVNQLTLHDIHDIYQIIGAIEGEVLREIFGSIKKRHIDKLRSLNAEMRNVLHRQKYYEYYTLNLDFHNVFLQLSKNTSLDRTLMPLKQRLYDFQFRPYVHAWEDRNCKEHDQIIESIEQGRQEEAIHLLRDVHWSYSVQEEFIRQFYQASGPV